MKKFLVSAIAVIIIAMSFASCYDPLSATNHNNSNAPDATTASEAKNTKAKKLNVKDYDKTLAGLRDYMIDSGFITIAEKNSNVTKMKAELIGAAKGYKYTMGNVRIELYAFSKKGKNKTRDSIIESVKKNGTYEIYSQTIPAYLSSDEKFLMVYADSDIHEGDTTSDQYKNMQKAVKAFKKF